MPGLPERRASLTIQRRRQAVTTPILGQVLLLGQVLQDRLTGPEYS
jgi:hypothetical protein